MINKVKPQLTEEQYNKLNTKELEWFLKTAYYSQFITGLTMQQADVLFGVYNEIFSPKIRKTACSRCRLEVCNKLGKLFYEYRDAQQNKLMPVEQNILMDEKETEKEPQKPSQKKVRKWRLRK